MRRKIMSNGLQSEPDRRGYFLTGQMRIIQQNRLKVFAGGELFENELDGDPRSFDNRLADHYLGFISIKFSIALKYYFPLNDSIYFRVTSFSSAYEGMT